MDKTTRTDFLAAVLMHDISSFNQTTRGYVEMLLDEQMGQIDDEQARALNNCLRQCRRIQSLVESVRLLIQLSREPPALKEIDLDETIREVMQAVQNEFADREIRVRFTAAGRIARAEETLHLVFKHLVTNAVRYNDCEVVEVDLEIQPATEPFPMTWNIKVSDNGQGVPPAKQELLFTRLERREFHGSGLGLSLVQELVTRWGGKVWLEKTSDKGTTFALTLAGVELP